ncbi:hypothetical protein BS613_01610 [Listeria monocytogenes]|nr:hypothetical protein BS613_01610 [Listeria monocytogenes]
MDMWITSVDNLCVSSEYLVEKNNFDNLINKHRFIFEKNTFFCENIGQKRKMWIESHLSTFLLFISWICDKENNFT